MTLPLTGPLTMSMVNTEMRYTPKSRVSLNDVLVRSMGKKPTGSISMSDLYGKSSKILTTKTFTSGATWIAPTSTNLILTLVGRGGVGYRGYSYIVGYELVKLVEVYKFTEPYPSIYTYVISSSETRSPSTASASVPGSSGYAWYTEGYREGMPTSQSQIYYRYTKTTYRKEEETDRVPSYYGGDAIAFGRTFSGTYGEAAIEGTLTNITIVPGQSYQIIVPSGGVIAITYEEDRA